MFSSGMENELAVSYTRHCRDSERQPGSPSCTVRLEKLWLPCSTLLYCAEAGGIELFRNFDCRDEKSRNGDESHKKHHTGSGREERVSNFSSFICSSEILGIHSFFETTAPEPQRAVACHSVVLFLRIQSQFPLRNDLTWARWEVSPKSKLLQNVCQYLC